jgi:hypothetical protein
VGRRRLRRSQPCACPGCPASPGAPPDSERLPISSPGVAYCELPPHRHDPRLGRCAFAGGTPWSPAFAREPMPSLRSAARHREGRRFRFFPLLTPLSFHMTVPASAYRGRYPTRSLLGQSLPLPACGLVACSPSPVRACTGGYSVPIRPFGAALRSALSAGPPWWMHGRTPLDLSAPMDHALAGQTRYLAWV